MQYNEQAFLLFTHVISQICRHYISPEHINTSNIIKYEPPQTPEEWLKYCEKILTQTNQLSYKLKYLTTKKKVGYQTLAQTIWQQLQISQKPNHSLAFYGSPNYPNLLKEIPDPPLALSVIGPIEQLQQRRTVAIIGSRKANNNILELSFNIARYLNHLNYMIISGGALGCDIAAHRGSLSCNSPSPTTVVFANGLQQLYPASHRKYFQQIAAQQGILLSERLWEQGVRPYDFPVRNRIISGLVRKIIIMEAEIRSGSYVTARLALEQGREVLVLNNCKASGNRQLIEDGAQYFNNINDLQALLED